MKHHFTTLEQSKKLLELGLPLTSADMFYRPTRDEYGNVDGYFDQPEIMTDNAMMFFHQCNYVPCWSLSTLIDLLPSNFIHEGIGYYIYLNKETNKDNKPQYFVQYFTAEDSSFDIIVIRDNFVDACYEMISELKERNML